MFIFCFTFYYGKQCENKKISGLCFIKAILSVSTNLPEE